ncbi:MAG: hypothetical protein ACYCST_12245 [Acidimicrobiales bacterium]
MQHRRKKTWVTVVEAWNGNHGPILETLSYRSRKAKGSYFRVSLTWHCVVFADTDLSLPLRSGGRGRPPGPPHSGWWLTADQALSYLSKVLACKDIETMSSAGWHIRLTRPKSAGDGQIKFVTRTSADNLDAAMSIGLDAVGVILPAHALSPRRNFYLTDTRAITVLTTALEVVRSARYSGVQPSRPDLVGTVVALLRRCGEPLGAPGPMVRSRFCAPVRHRQSTRTAAPCSSRAPVPISRQLRPGREPAALA